MRARAVYTSLILAASCCALPSLAQARVEFEVNVAPPPDQVEVVPAPRPGYRWEKGYWKWDNDRYNWNRGRYIKDREGHEYSEGRWEHDGNHYRFHGGHWDDD